MGTYTLPDGYVPEDIVGIARIDAHAMTCAWYRNWYVSCGTNNDLGHTRAPYLYTLPDGFTPDDIVDVAWVDNLEMACVWFRDNHVSCGRTHDLDAVRPLYEYRLPVVPEKQYRRVTVKFTEMFIQRTGTDPGDHEELNMNFLLLMDCRHRMFQREFRPKEKIPNQNDPQ